MFKKPKLTEPYCPSAYVSKGGGSTVAHVCTRGEGHEGLHMAWVDRRAVSWDDEGSHWWSGGLGGVKEGSNRMPETLEISQAFSDMLNAPVEIPLNHRDRELVERMMDEMPHTPMRKDEEQN